MKVVMLAAGEGTRLRPHTLKIPKPAIPFLGVPLAYHSLGLFEDLSKIELTVNTFHLPNEIVKTYQAVENRLKALSFSHESPKILGSGGALVNMRKQLEGSDSFYLINADEVILPSKSQLMTEAFKKHTSEGNLATLFVIKHPEVGTKFGGVWARGSDVSGFGKTSPASNLEPWHFVGVQILSPKVLQYLPESGESNILYDGLASAIQAGEKVQILPIEAQWFETGNPLDFLKATDVCIASLMNSTSTEGRALKKTLDTFSPESWSVVETIKGKALVFQSSLAALQQVDIQGFAVLGRGLKVENGVSIRNSVINDNVSLFSGEKVYDTLSL